MHWLLFYQKAPNFASRQAALTPAHREHVMKAAHQNMVLAGSLAHPDDGAALMVFETDSPGDVEAFARLDPYVTGGVVTRWTVRSWNLVVGAGRLAPEA